MLRSGVLTENKEGTEWCSQSFPVQKPGSDLVKCRWVTDFRNLNKALKRPVWGSESSSQLFRHIDPKARYFACFNAISGYHQICVDAESSKLLNVVTQLGNYRFTVLGQGICSSQDLFNFITDGGIKIDEDFNCLKNIDDFLLYSESLQGLEEQIGKLIKLCQRINFKLSPSKFTLSESVKFGGTVISAEKIKNLSIIFLDPPDSRILIITEMPAPKSKKELQSYCGMISSLHSWFPNISFANKNLRAGCSVPCWGRMG